MVEPLDGLDAFKATFGASAVPDVTDDELREIDELRRLSADVAEPDEPTYTVGVNGAPAEYTVHFRNIIR